MKENKTLVGEIHDRLQSRLWELEKGALEAGRLRPGNEGDAARYTHAIGEVRDAVELVEKLMSSGVDELATMGDRGPMDREHLAWRHLCTEHDSTHGGSVNDPENEELIRAIRLWGEELVALRLTQSLETVDRARSEARELYPEGGVPIE